MHNSEWLRVIFCSTDYNTSSTPLSSLTWFSHSWDVWLKQVKLGHFECLFGICTKLFPKQLPKKIKHIYGALNPEECVYWN